MDEKEIEEMMRKAVEKQKGKFLKFVSPGNSGVPDRVAIFPGGEIWFVELKKDGGVARPLQKKWQKILKGLGCHAAIIEGKAEAKEWIEKHRWWFYGI